MLVEKDLNKLIGNLVEGNSAKIHIDGFPISIQMVDRGLGLALSTPVYSGGNYIPKSVRGCLKIKDPFGHQRDTHLVIDEENFSIFLHFNGKVDTAAGQAVLDLLEAFTWLADKWREYLDEHDKFDLVHIYAR